MTPWLTVVGIGEDGFKGLGKNARHALLRAAKIFGGQRHLDLLPPCIRGERRPWPLELGNLSIGERDMRKLFSTPSFTSSTLRLATPSLSNR